MKTDPHVKAYADFLAAKAKIKVPLKAVFDYSNGPVSIVAKELSKRLSASLEIISMNEEVHPDFPAHGPDPSAPEALTELGKKVVEAKADLGVAFDGDGDRAVFLDERGVPIPPAVVAFFLMKNTPGIHVVDVLLYQAIAHLDPAFKDRLVPSKVGRFFISQEMRKSKASLGAEFSGHFFFGEFFGLDSGLLNAIFVLNALSETGRPASASFSRFGGHTVVARKAELTRSFDELAAAARKKAESRNSRVSDLDGLTIDFGDSWVNMRPSNTEPIVRITAGADDAILAQNLAEEFERSFV